MGNIWFYHLANKLYKKKFKILPRILFRLGILFNSAAISYKAQIDKGVEFCHGGIGVTVGDNVVIKQGTKIETNVTIGGRDKRGGNVHIGKNVLLGAGAIVIGSLHIGDNAKIGANAVVLTDVPPGATAVGVPAKIINKEISHDERI